MTMAGNLLKKEI